MELRSVGGIGMRTVARFGFRAKILFCQNYFVRSYFVRTYFDRTTGKG